MAFVLILLIFTLPIILIVSIIVAIIKSVRKDDGKKSESFGNIVRTMYIYSVMIVFLLIIITSTISIFDSTLNILLPEKMETNVFEQVLNRNNSIVNLTTNGALLALSLPIYVYYNKISKKDKK